MALQTFSNLESLFSIRTKINANFTELYASVAALATVVGTGGVTGSGLTVLQTSPTLITPTLGVARASSVTIGSGANGVIIYNTVDEVTNYEMVRMQRSGNRFDITGGSGGSGSGRSLRIGVNSAGGDTSGGTEYINISGGGITYFNRGSPSATAAHQFTGGASTLSSLVFTHATIAPSISHTGSAGYTALLINPTETSTGSGAKNLILAQVGGAARFAVTNTLATLIGYGTEAPTHTVTHSSGSTGTASYNTIDQTTNFERLRSYVSGNVFYIISESSGTGTSRSIGIGATTNGNTGIPGVRTDRNTDSIIHNLRASSSPTIKHVVSIGTNTASSGTLAVSQILATINQSSSAGYTMLLVNPTISATGSGLQLLQDRQAGSTSLVVIDSSGRQGRLTNVPTHTDTHGSTSTGLVLYNTADQVTNFERARIQRAGNLFKIAVGLGGTGSTRSIRLINNSAGDGDTSAQYIDLGSSLTSFVMRSSPSSLVGHTFTISGSGSTLSSGILTLVNIQPTINHSSTAGYTALLINPTETSTGSGAKNLILAQVGGVTKFSVDNNGAIKIGNTVATAVSVASTHKVTIDIGGTTYYLLASNV